MPSEEIIKRATATKQPHEFSLTKLSSPPIFILRTLQDFKDPPISLQDLQQPIKICRLWDKRVLPDIICFCYEWAALAIWY